MAYSVQIKALLSSRVGLGWDWWDYNSLFVFTECLFICWFIKRHWSGQNFSTNLCGLIFFIHSSANKLTDNRARSKWLEINAYYLVHTCQVYTMPLTVNNLISPASAIILMKSDSNAIVSISASVALFIWNDNALCYNGQSTEWFIWENLWKKIQLVSKFQN